MIGRRWAGLSLAAAAACGGDPVVNPSTPVSLAVVTQPSAAAQSGAVLAQQPVVELRDAQGAAVATRGVLVSVALAGGTGTISGTTDVRTDAAGLAKFTDLALVGPVGARTLRFSSAGLAGATSAPISLGPGDPAHLSPAEGNNQTAPAGTVLPIPPGVLVADDAGNPIADVAVTFTVTGGGGTVEGPNATSGPDGIARAAKWTLGTKVGANTVAARAGSLELVFTATATVGPPAQIAIVAGDSQTAFIGNPVPIPPSVEVTDAFGNPVSGIAVTFGPSNGGVVTGTGQTDPSGVATLASWALGLDPGSQTLVASWPGASAATFAATALDFPVAAIAAGTLSSCALSAAALAYCWGDNSVGQLGDGTQVGKSTPVPVQGSRHYTLIGVGSGHACAVAVGGDAYCWGANNTGQLGSGNTASSTTPVLVVGGHKFKAIALGDIHTCGIDQAGFAWCWGSNTNGKLGDNTTNFHATPVAVQGGNFFSSITAGAAHTCGLRTDGQIRCWGSNNGGRLGDGSGIDQKVPAAVTVLGVTFAAVAAGGQHTCAVTTTGSAMCWGVGANGPLGTGISANQTVPAAVSGTDQWSTIATGTAHTCGLTTAGQVKCWGSNGAGRLGDGTPVSRLVPTPVVGTFTATAIDPGADHTCARTAAGSAICWGGDASGQLGDAGNTLVPRPVGVHQP